MSTYGRRQFEESSLSSFLRSDRAKSLWDSLLFVVPPWRADTQRFATQGGRRILVNVTRRAMPSGRQASGRGHPESFFLRLLLNHIPTGARRDRDLRGNSQAVGSFV